MIPFNEPWVVPNYGCGSKNTRGFKCVGSLEIEYDKYCKTCLCLYPINNVFNKEKKDEC